MANVTMLDQFLTIRKDLNKSEHEQQQIEDKHVFQCLSLRDNSNLTPIHWAATQENVAKRQKIFAYLDKRMPGILDSRYNIDWFRSWADVHPWVREKSYSKKQHNDGSTSIPLINTTPCTSGTQSLHDYERTPRLPLTATTLACYDDGCVPGFPPTPATGHLIANSKLSSKLPYSQRLTTIIGKLSRSPLSNSSIYRAERVHVIPNGHLPPSPIDADDDDDRKISSYFQDASTPISSKRPSHNLLSNIVPTTSTPSTELSSSRQSSKPFASFGFEPSMNHDSHRGRALPHSTMNVRQVQYSDYDDDDIASCDTNQVDYICESTTSLSLDTSSPCIYPS